MLPAPCPAQPGGVSAPQLSVCFCRRAGRTQPRSLEYVASAGEWFSFPGNPRLLVFSILALGLIKAERALTPRPLPQEPGSPLSLARRAQAARGQSAVPEQSRELRNVSVKCASLKSEEVN